MIFLFSILLTGSSFGFVLSLRHYRMKKTESARNKVEFRAPKKANGEDPSAGNTNISINVSSTENRQGTKNNLFSAEDMKAIKFLLSMSFYSFIYGLLFVIVFYAIKLVNEHFGKDINFWAYFALYQEFGAGINFSMLVFSRGKPREYILERYSGFIKKRWFLQFRNKSRLSGKRTLRTSINWFCYSSLISVICIMSPFEWNLLPI